MSQHVHSSLSGIHSSIFILSQSYAGTLTSMLTVPTIPVPINSVDELVAQNKIGWKIEAGSILEQLGKDSVPGSIWRFITA